MNTSRTLYRKKGMTVALLLAAVILLSGYLSSVIAATTSFTYDSLERLSQVTYSDGSAIIYAYDAAGNRLTQTATAPVADNVAPTNQITSPTNGLVVNSANFTVTGTAGDNVAVAVVKYNLNNTGWSNAVTANNWTNWTAAIIATPGTNTIAAYATDTTGNFSPTNNVSLVYVVTNAAGYNHITGQLLNGGNVRLSYVGIAGTNYALDRTFNLKPVINWVPQVTNPAGAGGVLVFTNTPNPATNNFWRVRSVP